MLFNVGVFLYVNILSMMGVVSDDICLIWNDVDGMLNVVGDVMVMGVFSGGVSDIILNVVLLDEVNCLVIMVYKVECV